MSRHVARCACHVRSRPAWMQFRAYSVRIVWTFDRNCESTEPVFVTTTPTPRSATRVEKSPTWGVITTGRPQLRYSENFVGEHVSMFGDDRNNKNPTSDAFRREGISSCGAFITVKDSAGSRRLRYSLVFSVAEVKTSRCASATSRWIPANKLRSC